MPISLTDGSSDTENQTFLARILGICITAVVLATCLNLDIFAANAERVIFLEGTLVFVAGVAVLLRHQPSTRRLTDLVTATGVLLVVTGGIDMLFPRWEQHNMARLAGGGWRSEPLLCLSLGLTFVQGVALLVMGFSGSR